MKPAAFPEMYPTGLEPREREKWRTVRDTSIAAYAHGRDTFEGRKADVLRWLAAYYNARHTWPTSTELAAQTPAEGRDETGHLLHIRRGLTDLSALGAIEVHGNRVVDGRTLTVWRVTQR